MDSRYSYATKMGVCRELVEERRADFRGDGRRRKTGSGGPKEIREKERWSGWAKGRCRQEVDDEEPVIEMAGGWGRGSERRGCGGQSAGG
jgi:hypothetical protein